MLARSSFIRIGDCLDCVERAVEPGGASLCRDGLTCAGALGGVSLNSERLFREDEEDSEASLGSAGRLLPLELLRSPRPCP